MVKKLLLMLLISIMTFSTIAALADMPAEVSPTDAGTTTGLIDLKNPSTSTSTTTQDNFIISGVGLEGVQAGLYNQLVDGQNYKILVIDGEIAQQYIGSSGFYAQKVYLIQGKNELLVRAEASDGKYEIKKFEINLLNDNFWERLSKIPFSLLFQ